MRRSASLQHHSTSRAHAPIQARRGSTSTSHHSRMSSYSSSYGSSHQTAASSSASYSSSPHQAHFQAPAPVLSLDFSQLRPGISQLHSQQQQQSVIDALTRPRSHSTTSDWTTLSSPAGSVASASASRHGSFSAGPGPLQGYGHGLGLGHYMSSLPTVPASATFPPESFADIQVNGSGRSESLLGPAMTVPSDSFERRLPFSLVEGPTPTLASNANWRAAQSQLLPANFAQQQQQQDPTLLSSSAGVGTGIGQYATYPSGLSLYRTQGSAAEPYAAAAVADQATPIDLTGALQRPATALPVQTVYGVAPPQESGTITPEELLGQQLGGPMPSVAQQLERVADDDRATTPGLAAGGEL